MTTIENRQRWGNFLLTLAWALILIQAATGLAISWSMSYQTYEFYVLEYGSFSSNYFDLILAGLPFFMVALIALAVIPLCKVVYEHQNKLKKTLFLVGVIVISLINFETLALAFERRFHNVAQIENTQIYRLAQSFYNVAIPHNDQVILLATLWYSTIAGILVLIPILLAFGAFRLKKNSNK